MIAKLKRNAALCAHRLATLHAIGAEATAIRAAELDALRAAVRLKAESSPHRKRCAFCGGFTHPEDLDQLGACPVCAGAEHTTQPTEAKETT